MKSIFLFASFLLFTATCLSAQTKKIAWRSHSGSGTTFTLELPDEFGLYEPMPRQKINKIDREEYQRDSLATCKRPDSLSKISPLLRPVPKTKKEKRQQPQLKKQRQDARDSASTIMVEKEQAPAESAVSYSAAIVPTLQGATHWLWLLLLPLGVVFAVSIKRP